MPPRKRAAATSTKKAAAKKATTPRPAKKAAAKTPKPPAAGSESRTPVLDALNVAVEKARHLDKDLDMAAVAAARALARKIDMADEYFDALVQQAAESGGRAPSPDNVSIPTFLKYCESLGITPAGRSKLAEKKSEGKGGKLRGLSSVPKPQSA